MARKLSQEHLSQYKRGGKLFKLFNVVKNDPELSFEIREKDSVIIYFNKKKLLTVSKGSRLIPLDPKYYKGQAGPSVDISDEQILNSTRDIKQYFKDSKMIAYRQSRKTEFQVQQNITLGSNSFDKGLVVVDMEWGYSQAAVDADNRIDITRPDLVAVNPIPNEDGLNDIYLVEVKHSLDATEGSSGMQGHVNKTSKIIFNTAACRALSEDVRNIIKQKRELGIFDGNIPDLCLAPTPKMMFFLSYRSSDELEHLKQEFNKLVIPEGMEKPIVQYYNYTIQLQID